MDNDVNLAVDILVKNIIKAVREGQRDVNLTESFSSVIKQINSNGTYVILDQSGQERVVKCCIPELKLKVGMNVWVMIPQGNLNRMHIYGVL